MSDHGFKIVKKGFDIKDAALTDTLLSSQRPLLNCFINKNPRHFGNIRNTIGTIAPNETKTVISVNHNLGYISPTLFEWYYPAGDIVDATYGTGDLNITSGFVDSLTWQAENTATTFTIRAIAGEFNSNPITNLVANFKYYIFGNDFEEVTV